MAEGEPRDSARLSASTEHPGQAFACRDPGLPESGVSQCWDAAGVLFLSLSLSWKNWGGGGDDNKTST